MPSIQTLELALIRWQFKLSRITWIFTKNENARLIEDVSALKGRSSKIIVLMVLFF